MSPRFIRRRLVGIAALLALGCFDSIGQHPEPDAAISLPPFFVEPASPPERWVLAQAPGFELLTTNDATYAKGYARQYFRQLELVRQIVPDRYLWEPHLPTRHIVVGTKSKRQATDEVMRQMLARSRTQLMESDQDVVVAPQFLPNMRLSGRDTSVVFAFQDAPPEGDSGIGGVTGFLLRSGNPRWQSSRDDPGFYFTTARLTELLRQRTPALPAWLITGLTGFYDNCRFSSDQVEVATLVWRSPAMSEALRRDADTPRELLTLPALFAAPPPPPGERELRLHWESQTVLFVRWALFADDRAHREGLWKFIDRLELAPPTERTFRSCFGFGFAEARDRLSEYLTQAVQETFSLNTPETETFPEITTRRADAEVVGLIHGEWERLETNYVRQHAPHLTELYLNRARGTVDRARQAGDSADLQALAGLIAFEAEQTELARRELEAAIRRGVRRPHALQALAQLRYEELRARHPAADGPIPAEAIGSVRILLDAALTESPALPEVYVQLAEMWTHTDAVLTRDDLVPLAAGSRLFPHLPAVIVRMALLQAGRNEPISALQILSYARARCRDDDTAILYDRLRERITTLIAPP